MSVSAIIMMCVAIATVWGGLVAAIVNAVRHPEPDDD
ncbi:methionine/alanine import family NSS transporter small subunit [Brachybacterium saurashtrense]|uniref:Methionine/alanine import family NSS transporter small subunit n=1 Tax=Brachybacterium saurashtrense TaxID=556288 RepID=A0A345YQR8_9MICO|nr:methionine/alanine import family NSS transporter small subunit [Brachybacterium saurashtrense]AXK46270.1 methionine/alanine import family NSS transporter small subunit [Brachybacterium saurashtrense]RRR24010.1 methionine/alanine import family NSS transporter small subunit [Brachybacterium saurashtrense]